MPPEGQAEGITVQVGGDESLPRISNVFIDENLRWALQDVAAQAGVNIIADQRVGGVVSAELEDVTVEEALELLLAGTGFHVLRRPNYFLVFSPDDRSEVFPEVSETRLVKLTHTRAAAAERLLPAPLRRYVQADAESNTLSVIAPPRLLERIIADLAQIDVPRRHVMLGARVAVLQVGELLDFGIEWDFPTAEAGGFIDDATYPTSPWGLRIGYTPGRQFTNALMLTLNLLTQNDEATIIASPQLLAQDGKQAEISVTTEEYFEILTDTVTPRGQLEKIETGTILKITPRVGDEDKITLEMEVEVSDVVARGRADLPVVSRRTAHSTIQVESGGTAAVAGLTDSRSATRTSGVPGLVRIPLLGRAFRSDRLRHDVQQVAVFVTATLVGEEDRAFRDGHRVRPVIDEVDVTEFRRELREVLERLDGSSE